MSFKYSSYILLIIFLIIMIGIGIYKSEKKFFTWVELFWFYKRSFFSKISSFLLIGGIALVLLSLLDLRGPEKQLEGKSIDQKTIILIDSSASMLVEDVRPNRFKKSLLLVKHFIKKAVGQQISIVVFSDGQKKIVPFTEDIDLLEARINTLEGLKLERGGTGLSLAIQESIQHFKTVQKEPMGNILILTDGEENEGGIELDIPETISIGVIGIGTAKGGPIPKRDRYNNFRGNKKYNGEVVISKLNENFLKALGKNLKHYKYWIATSYSLPTEQILNFFSRSHQLKESENLFRVRPVYAYYLLIPAFILLSIGYFLRLLPMFTMLVLLIVPEAKSESPLKKELQRSEKTLELQDKLRRNELSKEGRLKLAESLLQDGFKKESSILYSEELDGKVLEENIVDQFNYATAQAQEGKIKESIDRYNKVLNYNKGANKELEKLVKENIKKLFVQQESQASQKEKESESEEQDQNKDSESGEGNPENKEGKEEEEKKNNNDKSDDQNKEKNEGNKKDKENKDENSENENKNEPKKKIPAIVKQLLNDDNQLQKKLIDAKTSERKSGNKKDW